MIATTPFIPGLPDEYQAELGALFSQLNAKRAGNVRRRRYYEYKNTLKDLGIAIPPSMRTVETVIGWAAKGVEGLTKRAVLDGYTVPDDLDADAIGITQIWDENRLGVESRMAHTEAAVSSCVFGFVQQGDVSDGEPEAIITLKSAEWATGVWDRRRRGLSKALSVIDVDSNNHEVTRFNLYRPNETFAFRRDGARWDIRRFRHDLGVSVEVMPYKPSLTRPFGKSRISRAVMSLIDSGVRTLLRSEVSAEFFSSPQRYLLGADERAFKDEKGNPVPAWSAFVGRILAIGNNEDGETPTAGQFTQQSFTPHFDQIRQLASLISAEFNMTPRSFGIVQDNPEAAEAIQEAKEDLVLDAREFTETVDPSWKRLMISALRIHDDSDAAREMYKRIRPHFQNPATPSVVSASQAILNQANVWPWLSDTDEALELVGWDRQQIESMREQRRRTEGATRLERIIAAAREANGSPITAAGLK